MQIYILVKDFVLSEGKKLKYFQDFVLSLGIFH